MNSIKALTARLLLKLPESWIYRIAGGAPIQIGGHALDPHSQLITYLASRDSSFEGVSVLKARNMMANAMQLVPGKSEEGVHVESASAANGKFEIPIRIYRPKNQNPMACALVYFHAGGGVMGDLEMCHAFCTLLASRTCAPVMSVDYRLAPEHPWPAGLLDCAAAYRWALAQAEHYGAPEGRAAVGGDSIGGNYAAAVCQLMKKEGAPPPEYQLLIYPSLDFAHETEAMKTYMGIYPMTQDLLDFMLPLFLPANIERDDPRLSPLCNTDPSDLPPALIYTSGFDILRDQGRLYHQRLLNAGSDSRHMCFETLAHGFISFMGISPVARKACQTIAEAVNRQMSGCDRG